MKSSENLFEVTSMICPLITFKQVPIAHFLPPNPPHWASICSLSPVIDWVRQSFCGGLLQILLKPFRFGAAFSYSDNVNMLGINLNISQKILSENAKISQDIPSCKSKYFANYIISWYQRITFLSCTLFRHASVSRTYPGAYNRPDPHITALIQNITALICWWYFLSASPRDLWPLRHLIRVMSRHDLTNKFEFLGIFVEL